MHDLCIVKLMAKTRIKSRRRHAKRLLPGVLATFIAASAMAFGSSSGPAGHEDEAPQEIHMAMAVTSPGDGAGDETSGDQQDTGGAGGGGGAESQGGAGGGPTGGSGGSGAGGGEGGDWGDRDGFLPNGENGLMLLADYANSNGGGADQGDVPGAGDGPTGGDDAFGAGAQVADGGAPGDEFQTAQNDSGGFGLGGGGGGGGSGGGGSGGGGGGGGPTPPNDGPPGGTESKPSPDGTGSNPIIVVSAPPPEGDPCELINTCDTGPINQFRPEPNPDPGHDDPPGGGGGGNNLLAPVPEPSTWLMLIVGFLGLGSALRVQRRKGALV